MHNLGLHALRLRARPEPRLLRARRQVYARQEPVLGQDGDGIDQQTADVEQAAQVKHLSNETTARLDGLSILDSSF